MECKTKLMLYENYEQLRVYRYKTNIKLTCHSITPLIYFYWAMLTTDNSTQNLNRSLQIRINFKIYLYYILR